MEQDFIQNHWKGKLIKNNFDRSFTNEVKLSQETRSFLENIGLPVILPIEDKTSFLPFTYLSEIKVQDTHLYIFGDFSPDLTGSVLLGIEVNSEEIYEISKNHESKDTFYFINEGLNQFLMCLTHFDMFQEEYNKRVKEAHIRTAKQAREEYENLRNTLISIDSKALSDKQSYWYQALFHIRVEVESIEYDEREGPYPPLGDDEDEFLDISREDLPF